MGYVTTIAKGNIGYSWEVPCTAGCVNSPSFHLQNNEYEDKPTNETAKILTTLLTSPWSFSISLSRCLRASKTLSSSFIIRAFSSEVSFRVPLLCFLTYNLNNNEAKISYHALLKLLLSTDISQYYKSNCHLCFPLNIAKTRTTQWHVTWSIVSQCLNISQRSITVFLRS